ncbi:unnamed protein product [Cuscuta campestris]|uniref:Uncharacterized protein n=1 Tax=Cuscuta campestris TaxID=132261 RepID=A0A484LKI1_9ASTE|nr:unnamed protein product [Cuscuta campestris]
MRQRGTGYPPRATLPRPGAQVTQETIEIIDEEETPKSRGATQTRKVPVNPPLNKGKGKTRAKQAGTTHPSTKRKRGENVPAAGSLEKLWVKMGLKLKEMGEVGPDALEQLAGDSPPQSLQLEEKLKRAEAHNRELRDLTARQLDEMANLSAIAGKANAEILQLKEENSTLMGEVSHIKEEAELKEKEFPGRAR